MQFVGPKCDADPAGRLTGVVAPSGRAERRVHDARGRLIKVDRAGTVNNGVSTAYTLDKADNRTNKTTTGATPLSPSLSIGNASTTEGGNLSFTVTRDGSPVELEPYLGRAAVFEHVLDQLVRSHVQA